MNPLDTAISFTKQGQGPEDLVSSTGGNIAGMPITDFPATPIPQPPRPGAAELLKSILAYKPSPPAVDAPYTVDDLDPEALERYQSVFETPSPAPYTVDDLDPEALERYQSVFRPPVTEGDISEGALQRLLSQ